ncbi:MAG: hypothetical protein JWN71_1849 [Xanthobacteraceae bacterium]|nr:hypothetical protein [Xanthobacteraceae bacterium]
MTGKTIGVSVPRLEDLPLVRGAGRFVDDIHLPGAWEAAFVRSTHAHALIKHVDTAAALALPGVYGVFVLADLLPHVATHLLAVGLPSPSYRQIVDRPILAGEEVVYAGEPIAVVIADNRYIAEDAAGLIEVDYEPLPAVSDIRNALDEAAPRTHRNAPHNLVAEMQLAFGDVDAAFASAPRTRSEQFFLHRGGSHSMEGRGLIAYFDKIDGILTTYNSTQTPHAAKRLLCDILRLEDDKVRVITPDLGGGFGPKLVFYQEEAVVCLAAKLLGNPVKWIEDRREHFISSAQERDQRWDVEIAYDHDGLILGVRGLVLHDHGAYTARGVNVPYGSLSALPLAYEVPTYRMGVKLVLTNTVPVAPVRGAGQPQGIFVIERLLDMMADELGLDRAEIRRRNLVPAEQMPRTKPFVTRGGIKVVMDSGDYPASQQQALDRADWDGFHNRQAAARTDGRYVGLGVANYVEGTGRGPYEPVTVRITNAGKVQVSSGAVAMGQSTKTMLAQIVADQLGHDMDNIAVTTGDTAATTLGFGGFNSRQTVLAGSSAHAAAIKMHDKLIKVSSVLLEVAEEDLEIYGNRVRVKGSDAEVSFAAILQAVSGIPGFRLPDNISPGLEFTEQVVIDPMTYASGSAVAEVEVDIDTGHVAVHRIVFAHDCGRVLHPQIVDGQVLGGIMHGLGNALFERMIYDENGQPITTTFADYLLAGADETPNMELIHLSAPTPLNALGIKGVGESGVLPIPAAVISAVENALSPFGVKITQAPISPPELVALIVAARNRQSVTAS